jgi:hypothetical protein
VRHEIGEQDVTVVPASRGRTPARFDNEAELPGAGTAKSCAGVFCGPRKHAAGSFDTGVSSSQNTGGGERHALVDDGGERSGEPTRWEDKKCATKARSSGPY